MREILLQALYEFRECVGLNHVAVGRASIISNVCSLKTDDVKDDNRLCVYRHSCSLLVDAVVITPSSGVLTMYRYMTGNEQIFKVKG